MHTGHILGVNERRSRELVQSCRILGIAESSITIVDHPQLRDGLREVWDPVLIAEQVARLISQKNIQKVSVPPSLDFWHPT